MPPLIDAHVHFWDLDRLRYPWLMPPFADDGPNGNVAAIAATYLPGDYRAEAAAWDVRGVVHVEAGADPTDALAETRWLAEITDAAALPIAIVAHAALDAPDVEQLLEAQAASPRVRGVRHIVNWHADARRSYTPRDLTQDPAWRRGFGLLAHHDLSCDLQCYPGQMAALVPLFAVHDTVPVIVNHAGMQVAGDHAGWRAGMQALAVLPNIAVKLSGIGFVARDWTDELVRDQVNETIDLFGTGRVMLASDFPTDRLFGSFDRTLGALTDAIAAYSADEQAAMCAGNANRVYRLGIAL